MQTLGSEKARSKTWVTSPESTDSPDALFEREEGPQLPVGLVFSDTPRLQGGIFTPLIGFMGCQGTEIRTWVHQAITATITSNFLHQNAFGGHFRKENEIYAMSVKSRCSR